MYIYIVTQLDGASVPSEAVCYEPIAYEEKNCRLYFKASFPALGYRHFVISPDNYKASAATASIKGISKILPYPKDSSIEVINSTRHRLTVVHSLIKT